jgi:putative phosphoesterase
MTSTGSGLPQNMELPLTVGVIADTHIPDRVNALHPCLLPVLQKANVSRILHAGDISVGWVLKELREAAPVTAVRGNRDFVAGPLRMVERLELGGVSIALMHGHGSLLSYLLDKWYYWRDGYRLKRYAVPLLRESSPARVTIFGHTHHTEAQWYGPRLLLNPGSASFGCRRIYPPTLALLHIFPGGDLRVEFVALRGWKIRGGAWMKE